MNPLKAILIISIVALLNGQASEDYESEIDSVAEDLAAAIKDSGRKKVSVLDFADLQGNSSELGRFLAEQVTVSLVGHRKDFAIMDRGNLKSILEEHKLTVSGLVDPENAKKLGQFSGVDAIILGNLTAISDHVLITIKVIATDTAELLGATKGKLSKTKEIQQLLERQLISASETPETEEPDKVNQSEIPQETKNSPLQIDRNTKTIKDLLLNVESIKMVKNSGSSSLILATFLLQNTSDSTDYKLWLDKTSLFDEAGNEFHLQKVNGLEQSGKATQIDPGEVNPVNLQYYGYVTDILPPYRLQFGILEGDRNEPTLRNFVIDIDKIK